MVEPTTPPPRRGMSWLWWVIILVVIVLVVWWLWGNMGGAEIEEPDAELEIEGAVPTQIIDVALVGESRVEGLLL